MTLRAGAGWALLSLVFLAWGAAGCGEAPPLNPNAGGGTPVDGMGGAGGSAAANGGTAGTGSSVGDGGTAGTGPATPTPTPATIAAGLTPAAASALCAHALGERLAVASVPDMQVVLHRTWVLCSDPNVTLFHRPQAGMVIGPDDRYAFLSWSNGTLVAQTGLENEGSIEYIDTSVENGRPTIQVDFVSDLALTIIAAPPIISDVPRMMLINNEGVEMYTYAAVP